MNNTTPNPGQSMTVNEAASNQPSPSATSTAPPDEALAYLLSRLASLQGFAVPAFRFSMLEKSRDGIDLEQLDLKTQATEMWQSRFINAEIKTLQVEDINPGVFPLLWVSQGTNEVLLVRGRLSAGQLSCEDAQRTTQLMTPAQASEGLLLSFKAEPEQNDGKVFVAPKTANDWFSFALHKHRRIFMEAVFATFVISVIGLVTSIYTMQVYDRVVPTKGYSTLWVLTIGVVIAIVLEFTMKQVRAYMVDRASKAIDLELSGVFFGKALDIRMDARPATVGTFASQIRHFESVRNFMTSSTLFILADAPFALFFIGVIAMIAGPVALVPLAMLPVAILSGFFSQRSIERLTAENMSESNRKNGLLIEAVDGIESVKAAGGEWKMLDRYRNLTATIARSELALKDLSTRASNMAQTIQQINYVGMIAVGAYAIANGELSMGGLIACSIISGRALSPLAQIPNLVVQWKHAKIALKALDGIMAMPGDRQQGQRLVVPEQCHGHIRLQEVVFAYRQDKSAIAVTDLRFGPGERVAILGAVGSGKTTLIKLLSGLYKPTSGAVFMDDIDIDHLAPEFVREHVGYLPQDVRLFNGTLRENLTIGLPTPSDTVILRAAKLTGLDQAIQHQSQGLELEITEGGRGLSGGQRQLVGLTRMLMAKPSIMLLDEPTASMDARLEGVVMKHLFQEVSPQSLLIVVTHKLALLPHVSRIIVVDKGQVVMDGPRDQVLQAMQQGAKKTTATQSNPPQTQAGAAA
jgi:ATP-binding cassette, subfamily C, bacterial LapB